MHCAVSRMKLITIFNIVAYNDSYRKPKVTKYIQGESGTTHLPFLSILLCQD